MNLSDDLYQRCLNPELLCLAKFREKDPEAYKIIAAHKNEGQVEVLDKVVGNNPGIAYWLPNAGAPMFNAKIYRLSPPPPAALEIIEIQVVYGASFAQAGLVYIDGECHSPKRLYTCPGHPRCRGFIYEIDGERRVFGDLNVLRGRCVAVRWEATP